MSTSNNMNTAYPDPISRLLELINDPDEEFQTERVTLENVDIHTCNNTNNFEDINKCNNDFANDIISLHNFIFPKTLPLITTNTTDNSNRVDNREKIHLASIIDIYNLLSHLKQTVDYNPDKVITKLVSEMFTVNSENIPNIISKFGNYLLEHNILYEIINIIMWLQSKVYYIKSEYLSSKHDDSELSMLKKIIIQHPQMTAFDFFLKSLLFHEYINIFSHNFQYTQHAYIKEIEKKMKCIIKTRDYTYNGLNNHIIKNLTLDSIQCERLTNQHRILKNTFNEITKKNYSKGLLFLELNNRKNTNYMNFYARINND
ncbi:MAG: LbFV-ORF99-like protein [Cotesia congregata filamentous virus 2]